MKYINPPLIPEIVLYDTDLSALAFKIYVIIASNSYNSGFEIGNTYLAKKLNVTIRGVQKAVNILSQKGYILKKIEHNNKTILTIPALEVDIKSAQNNDVDYQTFKKNVLKILEDNKTTYAITSQDAGLQGIYKKDTKFIIDKENARNKYLVWNCFVNSYLSAEDAGVFWKSWWIKNKGNYDKFFRNLEMELKNG